MISIILKDNNDIFNNLLPLTFTRPVADLRIGIFTIAEKWQRLTGATVFYQTAPFLQPLFDLPTLSDDILVISSHIIPDKTLAQTVLKLEVGQILFDHSRNEIARRGNLTDPPAEELVYPDPVLSVRHPYDIFLLNGQQIKDDIPLLQPNEYTPQNLIAGHIDKSNTIIGPIQNLFIHETARIEGATLNLNDGPVYIGPEAHIMEGATVRGPLALCMHSEIRMGARVYEATTVGPHCKVGGEVSNVVFIAHSNKAHDGFLGNSVIGEWCNLGGGTVSSNLKNDYSEIKLWNYPSRRFMRTGLQFCGLIMGDHSKTGINTMINTATVFGVGVNFHGAGYPRNFVPSFTEGSVAGMHEVPLNRFLEIASRVLARRGLQLSRQQIEFFANLHAITETYR